MDFFDHPFFRNLMPLAFKNQLENIQNIQCMLCEKPTFTDFELDKICEDCHEDIEGVMEELDE
tara:strand:- start:13 stop:201 length:189 start_codon:yes stop_codon:yes gene_type:complete